MRWTLAQLAERFALQLAGDGGIAIEGVCPLAPGRAGALAFLAAPRYRKQLAATQAAAVLLRTEDRAECPVPTLIATDPALTFAGIAALFDRSREFTAGVDSAASVADSARLGAGVGVGPRAVIESDVEIGAGSYIGPGCVVRCGARIGAGSWLEANVYVGAHCRLGERALVQPGAVIGGRGFGLARSSQGWIEVPQLGIVVIGDDVEIGANTCVDRGALDDTVIANGVKLDNLIQIAHNCRIGEHTAIGGNAGVAGSTTIGKRCLIGGAAVINGHIEIADDVVVLGKGMVTKSLTRPGVYGSGSPVLPAREWRKQVARQRRLQRYEERLLRLEAKLKLAPEKEEHNCEPDDT